MYLQGLDLLLSSVQELLHAGKKRVEFHIHNSEGGALNQLYQSAVVENVEYGMQEMVVIATVDAKTHGMLRRFDPNWVDKHEE